MEVHTLPLVVTALPHSCLLALLCVGLPLLVHVLGEADVCNAGCIFTQEVHVGTEDHCIYCFTVLPKHIIKVKFVELQALH